MIDPWPIYPDWKQTIYVNDQTFEEVYAEALGKTDFAPAGACPPAAERVAVIDEIPTSH